MQTSTPAVLASPAARLHRRSRRIAWPAAEVAQGRRDDWARAFAARLAWFGALDSAAELARLGHSLYEHYGLLDPYHIARMVWRRRPKDGGIVVPGRVP